MKSCNRFRFQSSKLESSKLPTGIPVVLPGIPEKDDETDASDDEDQGRLDAGTERSIAEWMGDGDFGGGGGDDFEEEEDDVFDAQDQDQDGEDGECVLCPRD